MLLMCINSVALSKLNFFKDKLGKVAHEIC